MSQHEQRRAGRCEGDQAADRGSARRLPRWIAALLWLCVPVAGLAQTPDNAYSYSRTSSFTYSATTGLLASETVEPNNPQSCVVTTYGYDTYGNKTTATTSSCAGATGHAVVAPRTTSSSFAGVAGQTITAGGASVPVTVPPGQFADTTSNALGQSQHTTYDPRFAAALTLTGPNGLTTTWSYDDFGRKTLEMRADHTSTVTAYCYLSGKGLDTSSNSAPCANLTLASGEAPSDAVMFVHTEPHDASSNKNGPFTRVYMDRAGRKIRTVTEGYDASTQTGGSARLIVQDADYSAYGVQVISTQPYFLNTLSSTASGSNDYGMSLTVYDRLGRPVTNDVADGQGSQGGITFGARGSRTASVTVVAYAALTTVTTNDKGQTKVEEKNVTGQVVRVTDALGAQLAQQYDAFANLIATKDALQNSVTLTYDLRGRKVSMSDPDTGRWNYDYDALGELVWQQSPNELPQGTATTMAYDLLGRMTQRVDPAEYTSTWSYDTYSNGASCAMGIGKLCQSSTTTGLTHRYTYDSLGRSQDVRTDVTSGPSFASTTLYDNLNGRVAGQVYPTGLAVSYLYTPKGFLQSVQTATALAITPRPSVPGGSARSPAQTLAAGTALWTGLSSNAWGRAEQSRNNVLSSGAAVTTTTAFDAATGRVLTEQAGLATTATATATTAMNLAYAWDSLNHVTQRIDNNGAQWVDANGNSTAGAVTDALSYDSVGRLQQDTVAAPGIPNLSRTVQFQYNALGMLLYKSDVGNYTYPTAGTGVIRPHAVLSVSGAYNATYTYDANGNAKTAGAGAWRNVSYNSFNLPDSQAGLQGPSGGPQYAWFYDEGHARFKEVRTNAAGTRTTWMLHPDNSGGLAFEREEQAAGNSNRHYISVGGVTVAVIVTTDALPTLGPATSAPTLGAVNVVKLEFWHLDRQGSLMSTTDHAGALTAVYAYDPFGKRRNRDGEYDAAGKLVFDWTTNTDSGTDRGYTGHEHLDDVGLIHMNGRLFDPTISRFMQGDPFIADPHQLQDYDRFAYCMNNPVTCTDPSGYLHIFGHNILPGIFQNRDIMTFASIAVSIALMTPAVAAYESSLLGFAVGPASQAAIAGFVSGAVATGNVKGALEGAATAAAFYGAGSAVQGMSGAERVVSSVALHAVVGCASTAMGGGKCGPGALSAAFADAVTFAPGMEDINKAAAGFKDTTAVIEGTVIAAVAGGTASVLGGGKFANGAENGAFGYLFNSILHSHTAVPLTDDSGSAVVGPSGQPMMIPSDASLHFFLAQGQAAYLSDLTNAEGGIPLTYGQLDLFKVGGPWDIQRVGTDTTMTPAFRDVANVAIGVYAAGAQIPLDAVLGIANASVSVGMMSHWAPGTVMDSTYTYLPARNVQDITLGYNLVASGKIH